MNLPPLLGLTSTCVQVAFVPEVCGGCTSIPGYGVVCQQCHHVEKSLEDDSCSKPQDDRCVSATSGLDQEVSSGVSLQMNNIPCILSWCPPDRYDTCLMRQCGYETSQRPAGRNMASGIIAVALLCQNAKWGNLAVAGAGVQGRTQGVHGASSVRFGSADFACDALPADLAASTLAAAERLSVGSVVSVLVETPDNNSNGAMPLVRYAHVDFPPQYVFM